MDYLKIENKSEGERERKTEIEIIKKEKQWVDAEKRNDRQKDRETYKP